jgi:hypothetical protein
MKNKLFTLAAVLVLAAVIGGVYAAPAVAAVIKAVLIKNIDEKGRNPYTAFAICAQIDSRCAVGALGPVPQPGQRLVIQQASGTVSVLAGTPISLELHHTATGMLGQTGVIQAQLHPTLRGTVAGKDEYVVNESVLAYVEAGRVPSVVLNVPTGGFLISNYVVLSGYFVDLNN